MGLNFIPKGKDLLGMGLIRGGWIRDGNDFHIQARGWVADEDKVGEVGTRLGTLPAPAPNAIPIWKTPE